jgi:arsenite methyltransferase
MTDMEDAQVIEAVRGKYAELAVMAPSGAACCGSTTTCCGPEEPRFGSNGYTDEELHQLPRAAANASLGCGNPTAIAELAPGETVLDLGSGGGIDVILSARRVGPAGKAYGLDMTDEMLDLARRNASDAGVGNVEFLKGHIEDIPLPTGSVDVVISNCVINLSPDKGRVLREAARVLRPGGRLAVSDVVADDDMDEETRRDMEAWTGCIAGALTRGEYGRLLAGAGLVDVELVESHRVHPRAESFVVRARKPAGPGA